MNAGPVARRDLAILYVSMLISRVGFGVIIIVFPTYLSGASDIQVAVALALYPALEAAAALPTGRLCDTKGRKRIFVLSVGCMTALMALIGLSRDIYLVGALHALMGVAAAGITVSTLTMITDLTGERNRGAGMGAFDFMNVGGYAVGLALGSRLDTAFASELSGAFFVTAATVAVAFVFAAFLLREPPHETPSGRLTLNPLRSIDERTKATMPIWLAVTVMLGMVFFLPRAFARVGIGSGLTAEILIAGVLIIGMGSIGFGALSDVVGRTTVLAIGAVGGMGLLVSLTVTFSGGTALFLRNIPIIGAFALATSALVPSILATVGDRSAHEMRGSAMGLYSVMLSGGTAVGTLVASLAHRISGLSGIFEVATAIFAAASLTSIALWLYLARRASKAI
ncbi:MAG TPA: MFS transporter [Nitrososphaerales archaeon]|nr:MFS transporter [Nitrososphaerales archaeon]